MITATVEQTRPRSARNLQVVDRDTAIAAVQAAHERAGSTMPIGMGPATTPLAFSIYLAQLGLQLKPQFEKS